MSDATDPTLDTCGCCKTVPDETGVTNPPGQPALRYRIDTQPTFLQRMLAALPRTTVPPGSTESDAPRPLAPLTTRAPDDPTIALLDAWATVADVLTFYQERIANEGFLRTATERRSVLELARQIGYELSPGVAASADLAFTLEDAVGAPRQADVAVGTKVNSVPGQGQRPQAFETIEALDARPEWNDLPPRLDDPEVVLPGMTDLFLLGVNTLLQVGDSILFVGDSRVADPKSQNWDVRVLTSVQPDPPGNRTRVTWQGGLNTSGPSQVFAFRKRVGLFANNAVMFAVLPEETKKEFLPNTTSFPNDWTGISGFDLTGDSLEATHNLLDLDVNDPKITDGSWVALANVAGATHFVDPSGRSVPADTFSGFPLQNLLPPPFPLGVPEEESTTGQLVEPIFGVDFGLFRVEGPPEIMSRADFAMSATVTRVRLESGVFPSGVARRDTRLLVESEPLALGRRPVIAPVDGKERIPEIGIAPNDLDAPTGNLLTLGRSILGLTPGQKLALSGKRPNLHVADADTLRARLTAAVSEVATDAAGVPLTVYHLMNQIGAFYELDGSAHAFEPLLDHVFELLEPPTDAPPFHDDGVTLPAQTWHIRSRTGATGTARLPALAVDLVPAAPDGETISETRRIVQVFQGVGRMLLRLDLPLQFTYDRGSLSIFANVAASTHGETVANETLGSGDATTPNQTFTLQKPPLTYVSSPDSPTGAVSTIAVRVNEVLWREVPALFGHGPDEQVYMLRRSDDGKTSVIFGDGKNGARLPTGASNVVATYRSGIGLDGQVDAGSLTLLATRPLGVRFVTNPLPATGAAAPATIDQAKQNAPVTVRALDRVVSVADVQDFASSFAGIGKAQALLLWTGAKQVVHLTVGGADGEIVPQASPVLEHLADALEANGDPSLLLNRPIDTFIPRTFRVTLQLQVDERFDKQKVLERVRATLLDAFSFARRDFGQSVDEAELLALAQNVPGVQAANVASLSDDDGQVTDQVIATVAHFEPAPAPLPGRIVPAELLTIDPDGIVFQDLTS